MCKGKTGGARHLRLRGASSEPSALGCGSIPRTEGASLTGGQRVKAASAQALGRKASQGKVLHLVDECQQVHAGRRRRLARGGSIARLGGMGGLLFSRRVRRGLGRQGWGSEGLRLGRLARGQQFGLELRRETQDRLAHVGGVTAKTDAAPRKGLLHQQHAAALEERPIVAPQVGLVEGPQQQPASASVRTGLPCISFRAPAPPCLPSFLRPIHVAPTLRRRRRRRRFAPVLPLS
jgi:hypothetical protein